MIAIKKINAFLFACVAAFALAGRPAAAITIIKVKDGAWKDAANWDPKSVPVIGTDAIIRARTSIDEDFVANANSVALESELNISKKGALNIGGGLKVGTVDSNASMTVSGEAAVLRVGRSIGAQVGANCRYSICLGAVNEAGSFASTGKLDVGDGGQVVFGVVPYTSATLRAYQGSSLNISGENTLLTTANGVVDMGGNLAVENSARLAVSRLHIRAGGNANLSAAKIDLGVLGVGGAVIIKNGSTVTITASTDVNHISNPGPQASLVVQGFSSSLTTRTLSSVGTPLNPVAGKITVRDGGRIGVTASAFLGFGAEIFVSGGGSLFSAPRTTTTASSHALVIGGNATFTVADGGTGQVANIAIGQNQSNGSFALDSGFATVLVTGATSNLIVADTIDIGGVSLWKGPGTPHYITLGLLRVEDGGQVRSKTANIGQFTGGLFGSNADGAATVRGTGSRWTVEERLKIGPSNARLTDLIAGTLTLSDGGLLSAKVIDLGDALVQPGVPGLVAAGVINIGSAPGEAATKAGFLQIETDVNIGKFGTVNFNHNSDAYRFSTMLESIAAGDGSLINWKGETTLDGRLDRYTGGIGVNGGVLTINSQTGSFSAGVNASGRLTGRGGIAGTISVNPAGTLAGEQGGAPLSMQTLVLRQGANLDVGLTGALTPVPIFDVRGGVTLDGSLNIAAHPTLGQGMYRIVNYGGSLTNNGLDIGTISAGLDVTKFSVFLGAPGQVNLLFGDSAQTVIGNGNGTIVIGGGGWQNAHGNQILLRTGNSLILSGAGSPLTIDASGGAINLGLYQFGANGFVLNGDPITLGSGLVPFRVGDGTAAGSGSTATINSAVVGTGGINMTDRGTLVLSGANSFTGGLTISAGTVTGAVANLGSGGVLNNAALVINQPTDASFSQVLSGTGTLTKSGAGALTMTAVSTLSGATTVTAGRYIVTGSVANSALTVQSGATLLGTGTVGALTVQSGAIVAPGNSPGTLTIAGNVDFAGTLEIELASATSFDFLNVQGTHNFTPDARISFLLGFELTDTFYNFRFLDAFAITGFNASSASRYDIVGNFGGYVPNLSCTGTGCDLAFSITAVPEPGTYTMLLAGLGLVGFMARRRKRTA